ncbi:MAG TPA: hypothetical protein VJ781_04625 [Pyrinomonadaceae bacterium]|nr:hypothetical protein [Pyrinomonadaceae bacterium]
MGDGIIESQSEQEHQDALEDSERRTTAVDHAVENLVAAIDYHPEDSSLDDQSDSEFQTTLPMTDSEPDETHKPTDRP